MIVGIVSTKGGVGKTTIALGLAASCGRRRQRVVVVDSDIAGHAAAVSTSATLYRVLSLPLATADPDDVSAWAHAVREIGADIVIVDAEGARGPSLAAAVAISDIVIIPATPSILDIRGAAQTVALVRRHRAGIRSDRPQIMLVPSRVDRRTGPGRELRAALGQLGEYVSDEISSRSVVVDALSSGDAIPEDTPSAREFEQLRKQLIRRSRKTT